MQKLKKKYILIPIIAAILTPSLVIFILEIFVGHISPFKSMGNIIEKQFASGHNLFLIMVFGLIPFVILTGILAPIFRKIKGKRFDLIFWGGLIGILIPMISGHVAVWYPLYSGGHASSTSVIAFFFIPFFCIITMGIGLLIGFLISLILFFKNQNKEKPLNY